MCKPNTKEYSVIEGLKIFFEKRTKTNIFDIMSMLEYFEPKFEKPDVKLKGEFINNKFIIDESSLGFDDEEVDVQKTKFNLIDKNNRYNDKL